MLIGYVWNIIFPVFDATYLTVSEDNEGARHLAQNVVCTSNLKHMDIQPHFWWSFLGRSLSLLMWSRRSSMHTSWQGHSAMRLFAASGIFGWICVLVLGRYISWFRWEWFAWVFPRMMPFYLVTNVGVSYVSSRERLLLCWFEDVIFDVLTIWFFIWGSDLLCADFRSIFELDAELIMVLQWFNPAMWCLVMHREGGMSVWSYTMNRGDVGCVRQYDGPDPS